MLNVRREGGRVFVILGVMMDRGRKGMDDGDGDGDVVSRVSFMPQLGSSWAWCGVVWCGVVGGGLEGGQMGFCDWVFGDDWMGEDGKGGVGVGIVLFALGFVFCVWYRRSLLTRLGGKSCHGESLGE